MNKRRLGIWLAIAAPLLLGLALRCWFILHAPRVTGDSLIYGAIAKNWMLHGIYGFVETAGIPQPTLIRLPGYPLFLIACFRVFGLEHYTAMMGVQCTIDLVTCLLTAALARRLFGERAGTAALWLSALCPFTAAYVAAPLTETLTLATITAAFYAFLRWTESGYRFDRWLSLITVAVAYGILLRPEQGLLAAAIFPAMLWSALRSPARSHPLRAAGPVLIAAICVLLPLVPWTVRNHRTFGIFQPLAPRYATDPGELVPLGFQRWYRTWAIDFASTEEVYWNYNGTPIQLSDLPQRAFDSPDQRARTATLLADYNVDSNATPELEARFNGLADERITGHKVRYLLALPLARLINMTLRPRTETLETPLDWWRFHEHSRETVFATALAALNIAYLTLATLGLIAWRRRNWHAHAPLACAMLASILLRCALLLTLDNSEPRYTLEFFPVFFVLASILFAKRNDLKLAT